MQGSEIYHQKRNKNYACLANDTFKFLDVTSYMDPGISYDKFLKAFDVNKNKGFFPYDSTLKYCNISSEEYQFCQHILSNYGMSTVQDFLIWSKTSIRIISAGTSVFSRPPSRVTIWHTGCSSTPGARQELPLPSSTKQTAFSTMPSGIWLADPPSCFTVTTKWAWPTCGTIYPSRARRSLGLTPTLCICGVSTSKCWLVRLFDVGWQTDLNPKREINRPWCMTG